MTDRREPSRLERMDRVVQWAIMALVSWLCISTMTLREQMAAALERDHESREHEMLVNREIEHLSATDQVLADMVKQLQIQAASHGWERK